MKAQHLVSRLRVKQSNPFAVMARLPPSEKHVRILRKYSVFFVTLKSEMRAE